ncbi:MAG: AAA family ATPase [Anaerolineae bacterium]|nr:AAA family ATPase [Anaerolineae bacterium]
MSTHPLTFLFTDLENSTLSWENHPEEMQMASARHDALMRGIIERHGGRVVKMTGDGFHAVFEAPSDSVAAALAGQQAISAERWPAAIESFKVRMGLHTGESQERAGDYYGADVNLAARMADIGHGGQVLLSETTATLVRKHLPQECSLSDLGEHRLKGIAASERVYQLCHPSLVAEFPPLRSLAAYKHNLPRQLSTFVGRGKEIAEVKRLLQGTRLLTLLGPGGTGKTRLMLQVAEEVVGDYADGVWLVELAPLTDPELIPDRVAAALNVQGQRGRPILDTLTNYLRHKDLLLLLDNVEHLVRESAELAEHLLTHCLSLKILVTGREALFIAGETTLQIPSLSLPGKETLAIDEIGSSEAVQLFLARAQAVQPGFEITPDNALAIAEVVRRLDGIPLALELAAARLRMMSVQQIAERLNDRFRLLTGGRRTALPRQQTLQALIDWSWNLLDEQEHLLLRRLSVFSGGWTMESAQAVASDERLDEFDVLDLLEQLINKSLVVVERFPDGDVRYTMLESIRQYARDRLFDAGEGERLRDCHAEYFTRYSEKLSKALQGRDMLFWLERFLRESDNAKVAREWALESRLDLALRMSAASILVQRYWFFVSDGYRWLREVVERARMQLDSEPNAELERGLACALISLGAATFGQGKNPEARRILEEGVSLAQATGAVEMRVFGLNMLLIVLLQLGEFEAAAGVAQEALAITQQHNLDFLRMMTLGSFTPMFAFQGKSEQALAYTEEAIRLADRVGNPWVNAMSFHLRGWAERGKGNWVDAEVHFVEAAKLFEAVRDRPFTNISLSEAGHMKRILGDYARAEAIYRQTILFFRDAEGKSAVIHQLESFGMVAAYQDQHERAALLLGAAQALRESEQSVRLPPEQIEFDEALAYLEAEMGRHERDQIMVEGTRLSLDEAVALALQESEREP